jgi:hypothetical protein
MNGKHIPAGAWCATCRWFRAHSELFVEAYPTAGSCFVAPPSLVIDHHGSVRPHVERDDVCAQWAGQVEP